MLAPLAAIALALPFAQGAAVERRQSINTFTRSPVAFEYPRGRQGFQASAATTAPCGGMPAGERTSFPLTGGKISLLQYAGLENVQLLFNPETNPTRFHAFKTHGNALSALGAGHYCTAAPDFAAQGLSAGQDVTMLAIYQLPGVDQYYYQCADITLTDVASYTEPSFTCGNYTSTLRVAGKEESYTSEGTTESAGFGGEAGSTGGTNPHKDGTIGLDGSQSGSSASTASASRSGLSAAAGGGIGAAAAVVVLVGALAVAYFVGVVSFGKKNKKNANAQRDDISEASSAPPMKAVA